MGLKQGPWGEAAGGPFNMEEVTQILGFTVWSDDFINGVQFNCMKNGRKSLTPVYGSQIGRSDVVDFKNKVLTGIKGTFDKKGDSYVVRSLTFHADNTPYGPYGDEQGTGFSLQSTFPIVGFFGNTGDQINAIGLYLNPGS